MGAPSLPAWRSLILASLARRSGPSAPAFWAVWPQPWPLHGCVQASAAPPGSDPQSHECPRAADLLEAVGSADSNEVFLRDEGEGSRSAAGQGESCRTGCESPKIPFVPGGPLAREAAVHKMATGGAVTPQPPGRPASLNRPVSKPEYRSPHGGLCVCGGEAVCGVLCGMCGRVRSVLRAGKVTQLCPTLCNPMDCRRPGSSIHGIFQARILEWVAISFTRGSS